MNKNHHTVGERAIAETGARARKPLDEINRLLALDARQNDRQAKVMPEGTYQQIVEGQRRELFDRNPDEAWRCIEHPQTRSEVSQILGSM